jgi:hypothetical protein
MRASIATISVREQADTSLTRQAARIAMGVLDTRGSVSDRDPSPLSSVKDSEALVAGFVLCPPREAEDARHRPNVPWR